MLLSPLSLPVATCPPNHFVTRSTKTVFDDRGAQIKLEQPECTSCATARRGSELFCDYCKSECVGYIADIYMYILCIYVYTYICL